MHGESHKGDQAEGQERRSWASAMHFFHNISRLPSAEKPDLVRAPSMGFVIMCRTVCVCVCVYTFD